MTKMYQPAQPKSWYKNSSKISSLNVIIIIVLRSWWYACCAKCHQEESGIPSWEPPNWQKICPYPLCPSYRQFAQTLSVFIIGK